MKYMGSKSRLAKDLVPVIQSLIDSTKTACYFEPFVGGCNVIDKVVAPSRIGHDSHKYLIEMWKAVSTGWLPPELITEVDYSRVKASPDENPALTGYVGFAMSFGGKWWGGYRRDSRDGDRQSNEIVQSSRSLNSLIKQQPFLTDVEFACSAVGAYDPPENSVIYCDPPYKNTTGYKDSLDYPKFYEWCRNQSKRGCTVLVSEYSMPDDFNLLWQKELSTNLSTASSLRAIESLFILAGD